MMFGLTKNVQRWRIDLVTVTETDNAIFELLKESIS